MGLRVNTNVAALNTARILRRTTLELNKSLERLSSGLRVNRAADDAAGLAIAEGFQVVVRGSIVAQRNNQDGINIVQTAEGALSETTAILQRMRELAVQSANGTNSVANRNALQAEVIQLLDQINDIATDTEFNGVFILNGPNTFILQSGLRQNQTISISLTGATSTNLGVNLVNIGGAETQAAIAGEITVISAAIDIASTQRSLLGAVQNRLEFTINTLAIQEQNASASESAIRDADIARETIKFTRNQILVSAGTSILAQANIVPQTALQLLGG